MTNLSLPTHHAFKNRKGHKYGRWTVKEFAGVENAITYWVCECECGTVQKKRAGDLPQSQSCGCYRKDLAKKMATTHGHSGRGTTSEYRSWTAMLSRCENPNATGYERYGAVGISVCEEWHSFENFLRDMKPKPTPKHSIDRIKNELGYCKSNCKWSTRIEQGRNKKTNRLIPCNGQTKCVAEWAESLGCKSATILRRIRDGWDEARAVSTPVIRQSPQKN